MNKFYSKYTDKLFFKHWVIGLCQGNIEDIIRSKTFNQDINWLTISPIDHINADPFLFKTKEGKVNILFEDFTLDDLYGKILMMTLDNDATPLSKKIVLDTKSHLSYPFVYEEDDIIYVFPEASQSGKLSCYVYDSTKQTLNYLQEVINLPLLDSTIIKYENKYWLFGTLNGKYSRSKLYIYYSNNLLGPYTPHVMNPVKNSSFNARPAGNFIEVDNIIYRPSQNCGSFYGESITINKVKVLNEFLFDEEPYMSVAINEHNLNNHKIHTIHTINVIDNIIIVDGEKWTFSPVNQWKFFLANRRLLKQAKAD